MIYFLFGVSFRGELDVSCKECERISRGDFQEDVGDVNLFVDFVLEWFISRFTYTYICIHTYIYISYIYIIRHLHHHHLKGKMFRGGVFFWSKYLQ